MSLNVPKFVSFLLCAASTRIVSLDAGEDTLLMRRYRTTDVDVPDTDGADADVGTDDLADDLNAGAVASAGDSVDAVTTFVAFIGDISTAGCV